MYAHRERLRGVDVSVQWSSRCETSLNRDLSGAVTAVRSF
jgi:hypothetical protein